MIARSDGTYETEKGVGFKWHAVDSAKKYTVLYSENKVFAVNQSEMKNLHNRYEGRFYDIEEVLI